MIIMEEPEKQIEQEVVTTLAVARNSSKSFYEQYALPVSILVAALIISGTLIGTRTKSVGNPGTAQVGAVAGQPDSGQVVDVKIGSNDHVLGNKNAKVTIVEFADFRCPFCERFFQQAETPMIKEYVDSGKARFVFKNYAFLGQQSTWASEAVECAAEQGKFWEYHNWLYKNQAPETNLGYYSKVNLAKYAGTVGLNTGQFTSCLNSDKYSKRVADDLAQGQQLGVTGTPTVFVNGQKLVGAQPYENFKASIDGLLKK